MRKNLMAVAALAAIAGTAEAWGNAMQVPRKGSNRDYEPPRRKVALDNAKDLEIAEWNRAVEAKKLERMRRKGRVS